jgi:hypothetical protein
MNFKFAIAASVMMTFAGIFTLVGCGGDACTQSGDHATSCGIAAAASGSTSATAPACTGTTLCTATCINNAPCDQIKDGLGGMTPTATSKPLFDCIAKCSTAK